MTINVSGHEPAIAEDSADSALFGATPIWERKRKTGLFGAKKVAARHPDKSTSTASLSASSTLATADNLGSDAALRPRTVKANAGGASTLTIAAVIGAVGVLGAAGYFMTRDNDGIPELASEPTVSVVAATSTPLAEPVAVAANTAAAPTAMPAPVAASQRRTAPATRVRPSASATETGINASATLPDGPQSYRSLNPSAAPQPVVPTPPVVVQAAPVAPQSIPDTAPIVPEPAPDSTTPPT